MKIYGVPYFELEEWTPEREHRMTRKVKILFKEVPKIKLVKMVAVNHLTSILNKKAYDLMLEVKKHRCRAKTGNWCLDCEIANAKATELLDLVNTLVPTNKNEGER